jgi:hypothetical protein
LGRYDALSGLGAILFGRPQRRLRSLPADNQAFGSRDKTECLSSGNDDHEPNGETAPAG